jgi:hypothetical protein
MEVPVEHLISDSGIKFDENGDFLTQATSPSSDMREEALLKSSTAAAAMHGREGRSVPFRETIFRAGEDVHTTISELKFTSNFECANLLRVDRIYFTSSRADDSLHYALWMHADPFVDTYLSVARASTQWFYYHVSGLLPNVSYRMHVVNFSKSKSVLREGMRPVVCSTDSDSSGNNASNANDFASVKRNVWRRFGSDVTYRPSRELNFLSSDEAQGKFAFSFTLTLPQKGSMFVALTHPYSYTNLQHSLGLIKSGNVRREILCLTPLGRNVDLIIATENGNEYLDEHIESDAAIGEQGEKILLQKVEERDISDYKAEFQLKVRRYKPVLFFCARAVGSDAPASFAAEGIISWLAFPDLIAQTLLKQFVIIVVPLLNPDGCALGHARADAGGTDLVESWRRPDRIREPSIYFCKRYLRRLVLDGRLAACVEIKAHSRQIGSFFYGVRSPIDRAVASSTCHSNKGVGLSNQKSTIPPIVLTLPAQFRNPPEWDFLLAYMRRAPFLMQHRACSFENLDLFSPPVSFDHDTSSAEKVHAKQRETAPLSLRQALHKLQSCPSLVFTHYLSIFKGNKGPLGKRHLHPGDYRKAGCALLLGLAESLGVVLHRSNRESYIALNKHDTAGGSLAEHTDIDKDFAVLELALRMGKGGLSGRHESFHIAQAVQLRGDSKTTIDDDICCDLDSSEPLLDRHREYLRTFGWSESKTINASDSPMSSDDEDVTVNEKSLSPIKNAVVEDVLQSVTRKFCFRCQIFDHEWGAQCPHYLPPPLPKKRIDEEYAVTDDFYRKVVNRYLHPNPPIAMPDTGGSNEPLRKGKAKFPKFDTLIAGDEILWLAAHFPEADHIGGMRSRKLEEQADHISTQYRDFKSHADNQLVQEGASCETTPNVSEFMERAENMGTASLNDGFPVSRPSSLGQLDIHCKSEIVMDVKETDSCKAPKPPQSEPPSLRSVRLKGVIPRFIVCEVASLRAVQKPSITIPNSTRRKANLPHKK